jgi:hypothetical protein
LIIWERVQNINLFLIAVTEYRQQSIADLIDRDLVGKILGIIKVREDAGTVRERL